MEKNNKSIVLGAVLLSLVFVGFFVWAKANKKGGAPQTANVSDTVPFVLPNLPLVQHIHSELKIFADGVEEKIPANTGLGLQHRVLHTHEEDSVIHVESQDTREYTLGDFMSVWGKPIERQGYTLVMTVDGTANTELGALKFKDGQKIVLNYSKETK